MGAGVAACGVPRNRLKRRRLRALGLCGKNERGSGASLAWAGCFARAAPELQLFQPADQAVSSPRLRCYPLDCLEDGAQPVEQVQQAVIIGRFAVSLPSRS